MPACCRGIAMAAANPLHLPSPGQAIPLQIPPPLPPRHDARPKWRGSFIRQPLWPPASRAAVLVLGIRGGVGTPVAGRGRPRTRRRPHPTSTSASPLDRTSSTSASHSLRQPQRGSSHLRHACRRLHSVLCRGCTLTPRPPNPPPLLLGHGGPIAWATAPGVYRKRWSAPPLSSYPHPLPKTLCHFLPSRVTRAEADSPETRTAWATNTHSLPATPFSLLSASAPRLAAERAWWPTGLLQHICESVAWSVRRFAHFSSLTHDCRAINGLLAHLPCHPHREKRYGLVDGRAKSTKGQSTEQLKLDPEGPCW